jgi:hypothetical protein
MFDLSSLKTCQISSISTNSFTNFFQIFNKYLFPSQILIGGVNVDKTLFTSVFFLANIGTVPFSSDN